MTKRHSNLRRVNPILDKLDFKDQLMAEKLHRCKLRMILTTDGDIVLEPLDTATTTVEQCSNSGNLIEGAFGDGEA